MRIIIHFIFIIFLSLVTFFGIGPVLFADGVMSERLLTLAVIIVIYIILIWLYRVLLRKVK